MTIIGEKQEQDDKKLMENI